MPLQLKEEVPPILLPKRLRATHNPTLILGNAVVPTLYFRKCCSSCRFANSCVNGYMWLSWAVTHQGPPLGSSSLFFLKLDRASPCAHLLVAEALWGGMAVVLTNHWTQWYLWEAYTKEKQAKEFCLHFPMLGTENFLGNSRVLLGKLKGHNQKAQVFLSKTRYYM